VISQAERNLERLRLALRPGIPGNNAAPEGTLKALKVQMESTRQGFMAAMDDDFNTAGALGHLFDLVRAINQARDANLELTSLSNAQDLLRELAEGVLGLRLERAATSGTQADTFIDLLLELRDELRDQKLWALSDKIRDQLTSLGVLLEDSKDGTTWRWK